MNFNRTIAAANRWRDNYNPLRGLTMARAVSLMEQAQRGVMADLQWLYAAETGIEATDPDLMVIIERTLSGVSDCEWEIALIPEDSAGFDKALAENARHVPTLEAVVALYEDQKNYDQVVHFKKQLLEVHGRDDMLGETEETGVRLIGIEQEFDNTVIHLQAFP